MPRYIAKFTDGGESWYLDWSSVVDAPVTCGMSLDEFREYYREEYGPGAMDGLEERLARVKEKGTSARLHDSVESLIRCNRAGAGETRLTMAQIIDHYCLGVEPQPEGEPWGDEES
jgi:hypothetical protein